MTGDQTRAEIVSAVVEQARARALAREEAQAEAEAAGPAAVRHFSSWWQYGAVGQVVGVARFALPVPLRRLTRSRAWTYIRPTTIKVTYDFLSVSSGGNGKWGVAEVELSGPSLDHRDERILAHAWEGGEHPESAFIQEFVEGAHARAGLMT